MTCGHRKSDLHCAAAALTGNVLQAEAARRLQAAKRGGLPTAAGTAGKRRRIASDDEEEEELGEEEEYVDSGQCLTQPTSSCSSFERN
jgi:hypothetical protein